MANASVEKLKALGLRHGEKVVMGLAAALSLLFLFKAATRETIQTTPAEVRKSAEAADSNLKRKQEPDDILKQLEAAGITNPNFEKMVDEQAKNQLKPDAFKIRTAWTSPEPGAGLIRDTPVLLAPTELVAYPGRGGILMFELKDGERIPVTPEDAAKADTLTEGRRKRRAARSAMPGMEAGGGQPKSRQQIEREKKEYARAQEKIKRALSGKDSSKKNEADQPAEAQGPFKEITKGQRWVAITGVLDYKTLRENYLTALKRSEVAYPHFRGLGVQRQALQGDGTWTEWEDVDAEKNAGILNNLPEVDEEWAPEPVRMEALVDPLPFLKAGYWEKVHVASLVPKEKKEAPKPQFNNEMAGMSGMPGGLDRMGMMPQGREMMMGMPGDMGMSGMGEMGMGMGMAGPVEDMNFPKNEEETLMVRSLDFTVQPDTTYRFRVRIIVYNPNYNREDISPGVDTKSLELTGPWSKETEQVTVPADVATYAMQPVRGGNEQVKFQVTKWDPSNGVMVVRSFDAGPGGIVGDYQLADIPTSDGTGPKKTRVDFNSQQIVLDAMGGEKPVPGGNSRFETPAVSLMVRPDGAVVIRNQAFDQSDEVRKSIDENYKRELEESNKVRESSSGLDAMGMPGS